MKNPSIATAGVVLILFAILVIAMRSMPREENGGRISDLTRSGAAGVEGAEFPILGTRVSGDSPGSEPESPESSPGRREAENGSDARQTLQSMKVLPGNEQESFSRALSDAMRGLYPPTKSERGLPEYEGALYITSNPGNHIRASFLDNGIRLLSGHPTRKWQGVLKSLLGDPDEIRQHGTRIEYDFGEMVEWFDNRAAGIEQGWLVKEAPNDGSNRLQIGLSVENLKVEPLCKRESGSSDLQLVDAEGIPVLAYTELKAWDSTGRILNATMSPTQEGLRIEVDAVDAMYPVTIDPLIWSLDQRLSPEITGTPGTYDEYFGIAVSIVADRALVGSYFDKDNGTQSGSAYIFVREGGGWKLDAKLVPDDGIPYAQYGASVSIDGNTAVIGAPGDSIGGSAYVYVLSDGKWLLQQKLEAVDPVFGDDFGACVSLSGNRSMIGADLDEPPGASRLSNKGSVFVFERINGVWTEKAKLTRSVGIYFGEVLCLDGDTALISSATSTNTSTQRNVHVYVCQDGTWTEQQQLLKTNSQQIDDAYGFALSLDGDSALVGAYKSDANSIDDGCAYIFMRNGGAWSQHAKINSPAARQGDYFGKAVSLEGDTALIGASGPNRRSAYVFVLSGGEWTLQGEFSGASTRLFGGAVGLSGDTAIVTDTDFLSDGAAFVFERVAGLWGDAFRLEPGSDGRYGKFGHSVAVEGDLAMVGAYGALGDRGFGQTGAAYLLRRNAGLWTKEARLVPDDGAQNDLFGWSVSICGNTALVGSPRSNGVGAAYVYLRNSVGRWELQEKLMPDDLNPNDNFGYAVSMDGDTALVGAFGSEANWDANKGYNSGSAYIFSRNAAIWSETARILPDTASFNGIFGISVSLEGDRALIGAAGQGVGGVAFLFKRDLSAWNMEAKLKAGDENAGDSFGQSVALSGNISLVGSFNDDDKGSSSGSAYVFVRSADGWYQRDKITAPDGAAGDSFGYSVSLTPDTALIGAYGVDHSGSDQGCAYLFKYSESNWNQIARLRPPDRVSGERYGASVAMDSGTVMVGSANADGADEDGRVVTDQGAVYVYTLTHDYDQGSAEWQLANGFDPNLANDESTLDSDGDGDLDILEIFQGTGRYNTSDSSGQPRVSMDRGKLMYVQRRSTTQTALIGHYKWSVDLENWHSENETADGMEVSFVENVVELGTSYEIVEIRAHITGNSKNVLFMRLHLTPNE